MRCASTHLRIDQAWPVQRGRKERTPQSAAFTLSQAVKENAATEHPVLSRHAPNDLLHA